MPEPTFTDPLSGKLASNYAAGLLLAPTQADRDEYKRRFVGDIAAQIGDEPRALRILTDISGAVGEDLTAFHPSFLLELPTPLPEAEIKQRVSEQVANAPIWRKALAKVTGGLQWWQENVTEPTAAVSAATLFKLIPGEQDFERQMREVAALRASESAFNARSDIRDAASVALEAYRKWDTMWGLKGGMELVFDPLNLIGLGLPGLAGRAAGKAGLSVLARPLQFINRIDQAPNAAVERLIGLPVRGVQIPDAINVTFRGGRVNKIIPGLEDVPGLGRAVKGLAAPHWTTTLRQSWSRTHTAIAENFETAGLSFVGGTVDDTAQFLTHMRTNPAEGGPISLGNIMNHLEAEFPEARWEKFLDSASQKTPEGFANDVADIVMARERKAAQQEIREGRRARFESLLKKVARDDEWAKGLSEGLDNFLFKAESVYLKKIEPLVVRPWSVAHLAFAGFPIMNIGEDIGIATVGMGVNPFGVNDDLFRTITAGVNPPAHLLQAEKEGRDMIGRMFGAHATPVREKTVLDKVAFAAGGFFVETSGKWSWAMRRGIWTRKYMKEFSRALSEAGVPEQQVEALATFVKTQLPVDLNKTVSQDIAAKTWQAMTTGDPEAIRRLAGQYTPDRLAQRFQTEAVTKFPEIPVDVRKRILQSILERPVTRGNVGELVAETKKLFFEWHKQTPMGIQARVDDYVQAISKRPPTSVPQAMNSLRMVQAATDEVANLPREIMAGAKHESRGASTFDRNKIWEAAFKDADDAVGRLRGSLDESLERTRPFVLRLLSDAAPQERQRISSSIDSVFGAYEEIGTSAQRARQDVRAARDAHFSETDRDLGFWQRWDDQVDSIWESERTHRGKLLNDAREGWNDLLAVAPRELGTKDRALMRSGIESALGEADREIGRATQDWARLRDELTGASPGTAGALRDEIGLLEKEIIRVTGQRRVLESRLSEAGRLTQSRRPSILREYDGNVRAMESAIKKAEETGLDSPALLREQLDGLQKERATVLRNLLDEPQKLEWDKITAELNAAENQRAVATVEGEQQRLDKIIRSRTARLRRFEGAVSSGRAFTEQQARVDAERVATTSIAKAVLRANDGNIPPTVRETLSIVDQLAATNQVQVTPGQFTRRSAKESLYTRIAELHESPDLNLLQMKMLREAGTGADITPTSNLVELVDEGMVENVKAMKNGDWRVSLTEKGRTALDDVPQDLDVQLSLQDLPPLEKEAETIVDYHMGQMDGLFDQLVGVAENPPLSGASADLVERYFGRVAREIEGNETFKTAALNARRVAAERTNAEYDRLMINYDNRSTFDFIMQRFMPFWTYESRRWPRLIRLAAKRPVLAKYFGGLASEWDYGYEPTPWGFEMNAAKGTIAGGLRRTLARDFPELHSGYRGAVEESLDWIGRFGFYFAPPITTAVSVMNGELSSIAPPPISNALYGLAAITGDLPAGLEELAFQGRYTNFVVDQVIADRFSKDPKQVRRAASLGDEDAISEMFLAKREAARRFLAMNNTSVLRYRPQSKREFLQDSSDAVEQFIGIDPETQSHIRQLGISPYQLVAVSGFQRRAIRETIPNYEAWVSTGFALRPKEEQEALLRMDEFWQEHERAQLDYEKDVALLNDRWTRGDVSGSGARDEYRTIQTARAKLFDFLKANPRFKDVPITLQERIEWTQRFGAPPPLVHPVDEILEAYYSIDPEVFSDQASGEVQWDLFFDAREELLTKFAQEFSPGIVEVARNSLRQGLTPFDRSLKVAAPKIREYFGIRTDALRRLEENDPVAGAAYREYRQQLNLAQTYAPDDRERRRLIHEARKFAAQFPPVAILDAMVRKQREQLRRTDPSMAEVYRIWIQRPS